MSCRLAIICRPPLPAALLHARAHARRVRSPSRSAAIGGLVLSLLCGGSVRAQQQAPSPSPQTQGPDSTVVGVAPTLGSQTDARPALRAVRRTGAITLDGRLDEPAWAAATPITELRQQQPDEGRPASERTEIRVLYDDATLYVGARMYDRQRVQSVLVRRDQVLNDDGGTLSSDRVAVVLDPFRDRNTRVWFELNPAGVRGDQLNGDSSWDPIWQGASHVDSLGWTAEFRIPLSQLRFPRVAPSAEGADVGQIWGLQFWRMIGRRKEFDMWAFWRRNEAGGPAYFGSLSGLAFGPQARQIEFVPYAVAGDRFAAVAPGDPFHHAQQRSTRVGADLKVLLTPSLTLDATVNPDFGQVEVDPATVNLSAYETFYEEKRPFFIANASYYSFGDFNCYFCSNTSSLDVFYSRRIGRAPQLVNNISNVSSYMDAADVTTILGAAKVTGRTASGWTVGMLDAVTGAADARYVPLTGRANLGGTVPTARQNVEPLSNYFLGRLRKDLRGGDTRVGGVFTLTTRALGDTLERNNLRSRAAVIGGDVRHAWKQRTYSFIAQGVVSSVAGDTAAILQTEQTSAHYFQRPDRRVRSDGLFSAVYDPRRTSLTGYGLYARLAKDNGNWLWETAQNWRSPGYEVNDMAFLSRADFRYMNANLARQWTTPTRLFRSAFAIVGGQTQYNFDGDRTDGQVQAFLQTTFLNYWSARGFAIHHPSTLDDRLTRGGPVVRRLGYDYFQGSLDTDGRRNVVYSVQLNRANGIGNEGYTNSVGVSATIKPSSRVLLSLSPSYTRDVTAQQYVTALATPSTVPGFGDQRYIFGTIDQRTVALETRLNTTFTPGLTLELYAQPFLASGAYSRFKEFVAPRTAAMRVYGQDAGTVCRAADGSYTLDPAAALGSACPSADAARSGTAFDIGNPDFNFRSLRGTAVLRWEYRPGSTLFAVWTQQRSGSGSYGDFDFTRERAALFRDRPINVFQLKATYWIGR